MPDSHRVAGGALKAEIILPWAGNGDVAEKRGGPRSAAYEYVEYNALELKPTGWLVNMSVSH